MKVIAFYLPQYHNIPENDQWWGDGFTEWVNVKKAKPLYEGHIQPKIPLNQNYYNLLDDDVKIWQAELAKKYGIYGFCYYHYWFNGKLLLEKPMEQMLRNSKIDIPFCICWANEAWTKAWVNSKKVQIPQHYGNKAEWKEHFEYLLPFMKDERYIKCDGKPLFIIYKPELIECKNEMLSYFRTLAKEAGFPDLTIAYQHGNMDFYYQNKDDSQFDYDIEYQPTYARFDYQNGVVHRSELRAKLKGVYQRALLWAGRKIGVELKPGMYSQKTSVRMFDYDVTWDLILNKKPVDEKRIPGAFPMWDNTPRHGINGQVFTGATPEKFKKYMSALIRKTKNEYKKNMIFINAWNEWAEGAYLEPDEENKYGYLEALKAALEENNEMPVY